MSIYYVDGRFVDERDAALPVSDLAVLRGYAVFDFLRTYGGRPFHLEDHLLRLQNSASILNIACLWDIGEIASIVTQTIEKNNFTESNIRLVITGGESSDGITPLGKSRLVIMVTPVKPYPAVWYSKGAAIITSEVTRYLPGAKSTNYIKAIVALRRGSKEGAIESVYINEAKELLEGTTSNLFLVINGTLVTPGRDILPGITRKVVLELARERFPVQLRNIKYDELNNCDEVFLTSSTKEVVPVIRVDDVIVGDGPGPVTLEIMDRFRCYTEEFQ